MLGGDSLKRGVVKRHFSETAWQPPLYFPVLLKANRWLRSRIGNVTGYQHQAAFIAKWLSPKRIVRAGQAEGQG